MKNKIKTLWPYAISAILLYFLFTRIDFHDTWESVRVADLGYLVAALFAFFVSTSLILWRWIVLMKALKLKFLRFSAARWFFLGMFCNLLLPSSVGGDVFKGLGLSKETGQSTKVFASIVLDRLIGFVSIVLVATVSFFFARKFVQEDVVLFSILAMVTGSLCIGAVLFSHRLFSFVCNVFSFFPKVKEALMKLHYDIVLLKGRIPDALVAILLSMLSQVTYAFVFYLIAKAMHQDIAFVYFIIFSPLVCVVSSLPSIGGLGVREFGWVSLLSLLGVAKGVALGLSLISFALMMIISFGGGLFYVATLSCRRLQRHQADAKLKPGNA